MCSSDLAEFASKTRDEWEAVFAGTDACVTPVLDYNEAAVHPANSARQAHIQQPGWTHPQIAPRLASQPLAQQFEIAAKGAAYADILADAGLSAGEIAALVSGGAVLV